MMPRGLLADGSTGEDLSTGALARRSPGVWRAALPGVEPIALAALIKTPRWKPATSVAGGKRGCALRLGVPPIAGLGGLQGRRCRHCDPVRGSALRQSLLRMCSNHRIGAEALLYLQL